MCGIGAYQRVRPAPVSRFEAPRISQIIADIVEANEVRGTDAAGIATLAVRDGEVRFFYWKMPILPSIFAEKLMEADERYEWSRSHLIIVHDRAYTTCHPIDNRCNHPFHIKMEDGSVLFLVHNGVIREEVEHEYDIGTDTFNMLAMFRMVYEEHQDKEYSTRVTKAVTPALELEGSKAILAFHYSPADEMAAFIVYRYMNPLVQGFDKTTGGYYYSSIREPLTINELEDIKDIEAYLLKLYIYRVDRKKDRLVLERTMETRVYPNIRVSGYSSNYGYGSYTGTTKVSKKKARRARRMDWREAVEKACEDDECAEAARRSLGGLFEWRR